MLHELMPSEFSIIKPLFEKYKSCIPALAIADGNYPGRVFADQKENPRTAFVYALNRWSYLAGEPNNILFMNHFEALIRQQLIPYRKQEKANWLEIYTPNDAEWKQFIETSLQSLQPVVHYERTYQFSKAAYYQNRTNRSLPEGFAIEQKAQNLLPTDYPLTHQTREAFHQKKILAFVIKKEEKPITLCRSNGFEYGNQFMVSVNTYDESARGQGLATIAGEALIDHCLTNNLQPFWETTFDNIPSQKVAKKLGFVPIEEYPVFAIHF